MESGGIISTNVNNARNIGTTTSAFTRGRLTAGLTTATTPQELFFHINQNTLTVNAQIIDNPNNAAATVRIVKSQDGGVTLDGANLFSGGTLVNRGTLTVNTTGGLGSGGVTVKNSTLNLGNKGSTSSTDGYTVLDNGIIVLTNNTNGPAGQYNSVGDRFNLSSGSTLYASSPGAGSGFNSLTRVTTLTAGGQIVLAPGAIIKHNMTNAQNQGTGILTIQNLGTAADLFFAQGFVAAQDRLFQMEMWRRAGEGRLSEVLGPSAVERDRFARTFRYRGDMAKEWASYAPDAKAIVTALKA